MNRMHRLLATFFYIGLSPLAPGTLGTLVAVPIHYFLLSGLAPPYYIGFLIAFGVFSMWVSNPAVEIFGDEDPGNVVIDEFCGYFFAMALIPPTALNIAVGFVVFRALDITKPPPIGHMERLPRGVGIVADDIMSGVYTNVLMQVLVRVF